GVLQLHHPEVMTWLGRLPSGGWVTPFVFSGFDATFLLILAAGSTYGTYKINRLRRQVVAARRLGQYHLGPRIGAGGMGEVYMAGLVHRDIKPSNIIAARRGGLDDVAKLLDFGLVLPRRLDSGRHLTAHGQVVGTPTFMAPEQSRGGGRDVDARSDLYSLGAV